MSVDPYSYPLEEVSEQDNDCHNCGETYTPQYVHRPVVEERNDVARRDTIRYLTTCPHCEEETVAYFIYYYD